MKLDDRLKELNELQDEPLKKRIRSNIASNQQKSKTSFSWNRLKEVGVILGICFIGVFLLITSSNDLKNHAATDEITGIYSYHNVLGEDFRGRTSTLFVGVKNIMTDHTVLLFENIDDLPTVEEENNGLSGSYDIVVVKNGEKHLYKLSKNYLYDVNNDMFYPGYDEYPIILAEYFTEVHKNKLYALPLFIPVSVIIINLITHSYYKRRRLLVPEKLPGVGIIIMIGLLALAIIGFYVNMIGPLYRPLLYMLAIVYGWLLWWPVKRNITNLHILKVERIKVFVMVLLMVFWISMY